MAQTYRLTDGTRTQTFTRVRQYTINARVTADDATITETMVIGFVGTAAQHRDLVRAVGRMLHVRAPQAIQPRYRPRVYLEAILSTDGSNAWRSEVIQGFIQPIGNMWEPELFAGYGEYELTLERMTYFEGPLTALPLIGKGHASPVTTPLIVENVHDTVLTYANYVIVSASNVLGDVPAPVKVAYAVPSPTTRIVTGGNVWATPLLVGTTIAFSSSLISALSTGARSNTTASGSAEGIAVRWTTAGTAVVEISADLVERMKGETFRVWVIGTMPDTNRYRVSLRSANTTLTRTEWRTAEAPNINRLDGSGYALPPWGVDISNLLTTPSTTRGLFLEVEFEGNPTFSIVILSHITLLPVSAGYRALAMAFSDAEGGTKTIVDDGIEQQTYLDRRTDKSWVGNGPPLMVFPGEDTRFVFLFNRSDVGANVTTQATVQMWYRPRRRSL